MAPTPEQMVRYRQAKNATSEKVESTDELIEKLSANGGSLLARSAISQIIYSTSWMYQKRILDHIEMLCRDDRQWTTVRRIVMGIMAEQVEVMRNLVVQEVRKVGLKENENGAAIGS